MNKHFKTAQGLALIELLVVIAIIAIMAVLIYPGGARAKQRARMLACVNNVHQIDLAIHMYLDDQNNGSPGNTNSARAPFLSWTDYRQLIGNYIGVKGAASAQDRMFGCPSDTYYYGLHSNDHGYVDHPLHEQSDYAYTSYAYNAGQFTTRGTTNFPPTTNYYGIAGMKLDQVKHPDKTVMIAEMPAYEPYSWHAPKLPFSADNEQFNDAMDVIGFADGHVSYIKMYYGGKNLAWSANPPAGYNYQWNGD